jgi:hypothetical protein
MRKDRREADSRQFLAVQLTYTRQHRRRATLLAEKLSELARPERFELPTPRFVVPPILNSTDLALDYPLNYGGKSIYFLAWSVLFHGIVETRMETNLGRWFSPIFRDGDSWRGEKVMATVFTLERFAVDALRTVRTLFARGDSGDHPTNEHHAQSGQH